MKTIFFLLLAVSNLALAVVTDDATNKKAGDRLKDGRYITYYCFAGGLDLYHYNILMDATQVGTTYPKPPKFTKVWLRVTGFYREFMTEEELVPLYPNYKPGQGGEFYSKDYTLKIQKLPSADTGDKIILSNGSYEYFCDHNIPRAQRIGMKR